MDAKINSTPSIIPNWFGLGVDECFGKTCKFGEFCSESLLYRSCRLCSDIITWCDVNRTHLALNYPSCYYICAEKDKGDLQAKLNETGNALQDENATRPSLDVLHYILFTVVGILLLLLLFVCFYTLAKRPPRLLLKMSDCFPGQKFNHTTLQAPESTGLLPANMERHENRQPIHSPITSTTTNPNATNHNQEPHTQTHINIAQEDPEDTHPEGSDSPEPSAPAQYDTLSTDDPTTTSSNNSTITIPDDLGQASTAAEHTGCQTGFGIPALGYSSVQPGAPLMNGGSGYCVYPVKVRDEAESCPKMALGPNTYNTDVFVTSA